MNFLRIIKKRHKWNATFILWSLGWLIFYTVTGSQWAYFHGFALLFFFTVAVADERIYRLEAENDRLTAERIACQLSHYTRP